VRLMEVLRKETDVARPSWAPTESTAFRAFSAAAGEWAEASPSALGNGVSARSNNLRAVRKRPVRLLRLPFSIGHLEMLASCSRFTASELSSRLSH
jgi:hypothetical protein